MKMKIYPAISSCRHVRSNPTAKTTVLAGNMLAPPLKANHLDTHYFPRDFDGITFAPAFLPSAIGRMGCLFRYLHKS